MANQLKMAIIDSILKLHAQGWSQRVIARRRGVHRETVSRHVRLAAGISKPAMMHAGPGHDGDASSSSPANDSAKPANMHAENRPASGPSTAVATSTDRPRYCCTASAPMFASAEPQPTSPLKQRSGITHPVLS
jgi:hypothetical protein